MDEARNMLGEIDKQLNEFPFEPVLVKKVKEMSEEITEAIRTNSDKQVFSFDVTELFEADKPHWIVVSLMRGISYMRKEMSTFKINSKKFKIPKEKLATTINLIYYFLLGYCIILYEWLGGAITQLKLKASKVVSKSADIFTICFRLVKLAIVVIIAGKPRHPKIISNLNLTQSLIVGLVILVIHKRQKYLQHSNTDVSELEYRIAELEAENYRLQIQADTYKDQNTYYKKKIKAHEKAEHQHLKDLRHILSETEWLLGEVHHPRRSGRRKHKRHHRSHHHDEEFIKKEYVEALYEIIRSAYDRYPQES